MFWILFSVFPLLLYFYLVSEKKNLSFWKRQIYPFFSGLIAVFLVVLIKSFYFPEFFEAKIKETWSMTIFISFIEAGLLEEFSKNGCTYLFLYSFFRSKSNSEKLSFALVSGLIFGVLENISYALAFKTQLSFWENSQMLWQRSYTSVIAHAFMNSIFTYLVLKRVPFYLAIFSVICLHGIYDFFALADALLSSILLKIWLLLAISALVWMHQKTLSSSETLQRPEA